MSEPLEPTKDTPPANQSGGINVGDVTGKRDVNVTLTDVAGRDKLTITNSPGASIGATTNIYEAPRKLTREEQLAQRNRQTMLLKVKAYWIDGVLANSVHSKVIALDMERKPDAVTRPRPWDMLWQHRDQSPQPLPPGTRIIDRFNYAAGDALLILGEPGSGKTTMLLELAEQLLAEAQADEALRIPVVFNLSSWAVKKPLLTEWLVSELQTLYLIPKKVAQAWVEQDDILPLLDGLDEVAQEHRAACIKAINAYREAQGTSLVVCSRIADYEAISEKLLLSDALLLRPLTQEQISEYLATGGSALDRVREVLRQDETLREMARSPLLLSIMALAYWDHLPEQCTTTNVNDRRRQLFATYLQRQLSQRQKDLTEDTATTLRQMSYLAHQMTYRDQTIFLIERLQSDWLPLAKQQYLYRWIIVLSIGLVVGLAIGLVFGIVFELLAGLLLGLSAGLFFGLFAGLGDIKSVEKISWSWKFITLRQVVLGFVLGFVFGLIGGLVFGFVFGLALGLFCGLVFVLPAGLRAGLVELRTTPNDGMKYSAQNALRVGLGFGLSVGLVGGLVNALVVGPSDGLASVPTSGLGSGLGGGLIAGGEAVIKHYILRFYLHYYDYFPFRSLVPFLDLAAERLILQKVGGGYRFVHRLLQEYLASLYVEEGDRGR